MTMTPREYKIAHNCVIQIHTPPPGEYGKATEGFRIVRIVGHLDADNYAPFQEVLVGIMASGIHRFIFDLTNLLYISSSGVGVIIAIYKECDDEDGWMKLCTLRENIATILGVLKVTDFIPEFATLDDALEAVRLGQHGPPK